MYSEADDSVRSLVLCGGNMFYSDYTFGYELPLPGPPLPGPSQPAPGGEPPPLSPPQPPEGPVPEPQGRVSI